MGVWGCRTSTNIQTHGYIGALTRETRRRVPFNISFQEGCQEADVSLTLLYITTVATDEEKNKKKRKETGNSSEDVSGKEEGVVGFDACLCVFLLRLIIKN